ncbi:MAG: putative TraA-like conjugal transfer protein [Marmoricola sp.]|nr:putative TraA-like conjugal transfer protein [Marmoricola sp.]
MGAGAAQLGVAGAEVSEAQMRALFGRGLHPDGNSKLGAAYPTYADLAPYAERVAARVAHFEAANGRPPSQTARNYIAAMEARRGRRAVSGYDLVFTPVKSVSLLWALGGPEVRQQVEEAHRAAVANALGWIEQHAAYTRIGKGGTAQIDTTGLVCAAFEHRESRAGDPDLHTHVAVANKVCGVDGKWRSLDARILYALGVAASERYNTRVEDELASRLGVRFVDAQAKPTRSDKRAIREIGGVPVELIRHFSRRRAAIEDRYSQLRSDYRTAHGREPDRSTQLQLAQQATLETRDAKGNARALAEQVEDWTSQARTVLGSRRFARFVSECVGKAESVRQPSGPEALTGDRARALAEQVVRRVSAERSTWTLWNLHAEAERLLRPVRLPSATAREEFTRAVVEHATSPDMSIRIRPPELIAEPTALVRESDQESVFVVHGSDRFTTGRVLAAEDQLVAAARDRSGPYVEAVVLEAALAVHESTTGLRLDEGQRALVTAFAGRAERIVVGIGPAGAGKTTAMNAFAAVWQQGSPGPGGGRVIPLATSARAADVLGTELGMRAENLHKFLYEHHRATDQLGKHDQWFDVRAGDVLVVDEAGMAGTMQLAELVTLAQDRGAAVRLLGDPAQLAAVDAGGALGLLEHEVGATYLTDLHRFSDPDEGAATLLLRTGDTSALVFYNDRDRVRTGSRDVMLEQAYDSWAHDVRSGKLSVLVAATAGDVSALNARARTERVLAGQVEADGITVGDGNLAGDGDWVVTRANQRTLGWGHGKWVRNGDVWRVTKLHSDGSMTVGPLAGRGHVRLPHAYVSESVELAYACTAHRAQGSTTDTTHALVTPEMTREALYVASTRGRESTTWYTAVEEPIDVDCHTEPQAPSTAHEVLTAVLNRSGAEESATLVIRKSTEEAAALPALIAAYDHALGVASTQVLREAVGSLPVAERQRVLDDKGAPRLARALASATASAGSAPAAVLRTAFDLEPLNNTGSPALVLASRIDDLATRTTRRQVPHYESAEPGNPGDDRPRSPLRWLPAPTVGHPAWDQYLTARAALIRDRAAELGSPAVIYREAYRITTVHQHDLGPVPPPEGRQAAAYDAALASLGEAQTSPTHDAQGVPVPVRRPDHRVTDRPHPQLTR